MTLYFIIFGNLIGSRIGEMHGFTYMQFIVPGLIMMAVITNAYTSLVQMLFSATQYSCIMPHPLVYRLPASRTALRDG